MSPLALLFVLLALGGARGMTTPTVRPPGGGGKRWTLAELRALAAQVGFPDPILAAAVAMAESGGWEGARHIVTAPKAGNLPERSFGLWQVNALAHPEFDEGRLASAEYNARATLLISKSGTDWSPWSTFGDGSYRRYMT